MFRWINQNKKGKYFLLFLVLFSLTGILTTISFSTADIGQRGFNSQSLKSSSINYLYGSSTTPHEWSSGTWTDYTADIDGYHTGDYFIMYTAAYRILDNSIFPDAAGSGWVKFVKSTGEVAKTKRMFEAPQTSGSKWGGTLIAADVLTLNSEDVEARISFSRHNDETFEIRERSMIGIPLGSNYHYQSRTTTHEWSSGKWTDIYADLDGAITGEFLIIYTAHYQVNDPTTFLEEGAHGYGWVKLVDSSGEIPRTKRSFEVPGFSGATWEGTIVIIDKVTLNSEDLEARIYWSPDDDEKIKIIERSMIAIPLESGYSYKYREEHYEWVSGTYTDYYADMDGSNTGDYFIMYTADYEVHDNGWPPVSHGWGWIKLADAGGEVAKTNRFYEIPTSGGANWGGTLLVADVLTLSSEDVEAKIYFDPSEQEYIGVNQRSMIAIPLS